jgi:uncharacterized protein (DUF2249 family)
LAIGETNIFQLKSNQTQKTKTKIMTTIPELGTDRMLDVRETPCSIKHGLILQTFVNLAVGEHFVLRNGHDPVPLRYQFDAEFPGSFSWDYVHRLPEDVAVKITKLQPLAEAPAAVPHCCGGH